MRGGYERSQLSRRNRLPDDFRIDVRVLMAKKIADVLDVAPRNLRIALADRWVE